MRMRQGWFHRDTSVNFVNFDMSVFNKQRYLGWLVILLLSTSQVNADEIHLKSFI